MIFEVGELKVTAPLDPKEGRRYVEPMTVDEIENLYNISVSMNDYVNSTADGALIWRSINSCTSELEPGLKNWQQRMHEVSIRRCAHMTKSVHWIGIELCDPPKYYGFTYIKKFV
jgi:hypothetical protein